MKRRHPCALDSRHLPILFPVTLALTLALTAAAAGDPEADGARAKSELGVELALAGNASRAESVFVSLLSDVRGDARALNNLGNLRLLRGEPGVALAFYDRALRGDSADAGILLNRATALFLMGDDDRAHQAAASGVRLAGGVDEANRLLGIRNEPAEKAARNAYVTKNEIRMLLRRAAQSVPSDTARAAPQKPTRSRTPVYRSGGPRGNTSDAASILYWKH